MPNTLKETQRSALLRTAERIEETFEWRAAPAQDSSLYLIKNLLASIESNCSFVHDDIEQEEARQALEDVRQAGAAIAKLLSVQGFQRLSAIHRHEELGEEATEVDDAPPAPHAKRGES